jgi:hypothetical protein
MPFIVPKEEQQTTKILVQFKRIWRNFSPGDISSIELAARDELGNFYKERDRDGKPTERDAKKIGDLLVLQMENPNLRTAVKLTADQALHHLGPKAMLENGYEPDEIKAALAKADEKTKELQKTYAAGEAQREIHGWVEQPKVTMTPHSTGPLPLPLKK